jgi:tetratricopeptide (TPR) repeat protein
MPDPYNVDVVFGSVALALLGLSMVVRLGEHLVARSSLRLPGYARFSKPRRAAAGAVMVLSIVLVGCGANIENANQTLANARAAGAASRDVSGASLDEARISFQAKHPYQCVADYTEALRSFPGLASAYSGRAACYLSFDPAASVHDLNRALALSSGNPGLLLARAAAKRSAGDLNGATDDYLASASAPSSPPVESLAATDGLIGMGQLGAAAHVVSTLTSRFPNDAISSLAVADLAVAQGYASRAGAALARADQLTAQNPSELVFVLSRECGYQVLEHAYQSAVATCERAAVTGEDGSGAFDNLSAAHVGLGDLSAAIVDLTSSIGAFEGNIGPNAQPAGVDGFGLANLYEGRGRLYIELHQPKLALADYHAAMAALPPGTPDLAAQLREDIKSADQD